MGTHRVQRVPQGDTRRHTSTVTVSLVEDSRAIARECPALDPALVVERTFRGSGPGGQNRNKVESGVAVKHLPTGIEVRIDRGRSQWANRAEAWDELARRVAAGELDYARTRVNDTRVAQVGAGERVSHDWTWCAWRDSVSHHETGRSWSMAHALRGRFL